VLLLTVKHRVDEVAQFQEALYRLEIEKQELEEQATELDEACRQLTAANASLSEQSLSLADEVTSAANAVRKQMEAQIAQVERKLADANEEIEAMRMSEQTQRVALLEELNAAQTENDNLRAQLRKK
jgi:chromosome segregation ATPase